MKLTTFYLVGIMAICFACTHHSDSWESLLDSRMSKWEVYLGYPHASTEVEGIPKDSAGNYLSPIGHKDPFKVFSVIEMEGDPVLRVSGEIYGCVISKQEFENYHLIGKVKWGAQKWPPREKELKDSGILYHSVGALGIDYWRAWALSQEFQIIEGGFGDYWSIAGSAVDIRSSVPAGDSTYIFDPQADVVSYTAHNFCRASKDLEAKNEWNIIELICFEDKSLHIVNGEVVMALTNSRYPAGDREVPLTRGKLQIQSEAAEVFYKAIKIKPISQVPRAYQHYFD